MSKPLKLTIGISVSFLVILVALILFLRHLITKSYPITDGKISVPGLHSNVDIYRDELGVPHISAKNEHDMFFAVGYVHAQDRLWEMDMIRRTAQGRLSEILGEPTVEFDKLFRIIGIAKTSAEIEKHLHPESRRALESYASGVNAFLEQYTNKLPIEFDMLNYRPERWEPTHSVIVARMMAWDLNMASVSDLPLGMITEKVDIQKASEAFPVTSDLGQKILVSLQELRRALIGDLTGDIQSRDDARQVRWGTWFVSTNYKFRTATGSKGLGGGSNCWVVGPKRSLTGKPILANDIHLLMPAPALWYQLHFRSPGWDVAGVSLPGTPLIVVGRNASIAWGVTNAMVDDTDFYIEQVDSASRTYNFQGRKFPLESNEETIYISTKDSLVITIRSTHHGPIVDDIHPALKRKDSTYSHFSLAMRWTGLDVSDEVYAFYLMNKARNAEEFEMGVQHLTVPGQNIVFADTFGNIGYWTAAHIPIRGKINSMMPMAGWTGENEWQGYIPFNQLPKLWNPPEGFIATANNKIVGDNFPYYISELWEPPSRITRIRELLASAEQLTPDDCKRFHMDIVSPHGKEFVTHLLRAFQNVTNITPDAALALEYLRNWDFRFSRDDVAPTIVNATFVKFLHNVFEDELGDTLLTYYVTFSAIPYRAASQLLAADSSAWFDDIRTPAIETKDEILRKSLFDALEELRRKLGPDTKTWRWGSLHTVTFAHPFGKQKPLDRVFNIGPFSISGSASTIYKTDFRLSNPYAVSVGPSMRHVIDLGNRASFSSVITSGESGQVLHKHYDDQSVLWLNGGYHTLVMDWNQIAQATWEHLVLKPQ